MCNSCKCDDCGVSIPEGDVYGSDREDIDLCRECYYAREDEDEVA